MACVIEEVRRDNYKYEKPTRNNHDICISCIFLLFPPRSDDWGAIKKLYMEKSNKLHSV